MFGHNFSSSSRAPRDQPDGQPARWRMPVSRASPHASSFADFVGYSRSHLAGGKAVHRHLPILARVDQGLADPKYVRSSCSLARSLYSKIQAHPVPPPQTRLAVPKPSPVSQFPNSLFNHLPNEPRILTKQTPHQHLLPLTLHPLARLHQPLSPRRLLVLR